MPAPQKSLGELLDLQQAFDEARAAAELAASRFAACYSQLVQRHPDDRDRIDTILDTCGTPKAVLDALLEDVFGPGKPLRDSSPVRYIDLTREPAMNTPRPGERYVSRRGNIEFQNLRRRRKPLPRPGDRYRLKDYSDGPSTEVAVEVLDARRGKKVTYRHLDRMGGVLEPLRGAEIRDMDESRFRRIFVRIKPGE